MRVILVGPPGAGKGTVSKFIVEKRGAVQISTGDILRQAIKEGTPVGKKADEFMKHGDLVPDALVLDIIKERLQKEDCTRGFVLDGFPRTIPQAEALDVMLKELDIAVDAVVNIGIPEEKIIKRLSSRRTCSNPVCQAIYNAISNPPKDGVHCDKCGNPVAQRDDETEEAIMHRLTTYHEKTAPLIDYYQKKGVLISVNGDQSPEKVFDEVLGAVKK
jgi:adenylate kinase